MHESLFSDGGSTLHSLVGFFIAIASFAFLFVSESQVWASASQAEYDVVVVGAGTGGTAAAIQAARMGASVALVEESDWVGGQMTGAAVSTMDDKTFTRTGIYLEFITKVREYYGARGHNVNVCYWGSDTIAFEPWVGRTILMDMLKGVGGIQFYFKTRALSAKVVKNRVSEAVFVQGGKKFTLKGKIFIDATECGDFIPLTGARYRIGNSISPKTDKNSIIQDITYVAVVKKYPDGLPPELKVETPPPGYSNYLFRFREIIRPDGDTWPGKYPFNTEVHNEYRAMPGISNVNAVDGGRPETWQYVTRTGVNWANDYYDKSEGVRGMSAKYIEDKSYRLACDREAMMKALCFIYYMQNELGMEDWSVDNRQDFGTYFGNDWQNWEPAARYSEILRHFPPFPYVRESRRIMGVKTMSVRDVVRDSKLRRTAQSIPDAIALGEYPVDIHGATDPHFLDLDLNEAKDIPENMWQNTGGLFQIPFGALIPEKLNGLIAAEKNISVSRLVSGATRLQPVTMLTGQAAGAAAALAVKAKKHPRDLRVLDIQSELWKTKTWLSIFRFEDVPDYTSTWAGVEAAMVFNYMDPVTETVFGVSDNMHWVEVRDAFRRAFGITSFPERGDLEPVSVNEFNSWVRELYKKDFKRYENAVADTAVDKPLSKGLLAKTILEIMKLAPLPKK